MRRAVEAGCEGRAAWCRKATVAGKQSGSNIGAPADRRGGAAAAIQQSSRRNAGRAQRRGVAARVQRVLLGSTNRIAVAEVCRRRATAAAAPPNKRATARNAAGAVRALRRQLPPAGRGSGCQRGLEAQSSRTDGQQPPCVARAAIAGKGRGNGGAKGEAHAASPSAPLCMRRL